MPLIEINRILKDIALDIIQRTNLSDLILNGNRTITAGLGHRIGSRWHDA